MPQLINVFGRKGASSIFRAYGPGVGPDAIHVRFKTNAGIDVQRRGSEGNMAVFTVTVIDDFPSDLGEPSLERLEVFAEGFGSSPSFVMVTPVSQAILDQEYGSRRVAPTQFVSAQARISFGKHRGKKFSQIAVEEPGYLEWIVREGAGSRLERESAKTALDQARSTASRARYASSTLSDSSIPKGSTPSQPASLPDPNRKSGIIDSIRSLFFTKR
jgi:hypothetical protein